MFCVSLSVSYALGDQNIAVLMLVISSIRFYSVVRQHVCLLASKMLIEYHNDQVVELVIVIVSDHVQLSTLHRRCAALSPTFHLIAQTRLGIIRIVTLLRIVSFSATSHSA